MSAVAVLAPLLVEVALTFALLVWTGVVRVRTLRSGEVRPRDIALRQPNWPPAVAQISNAYQNQLELPILFYLAVVLSLVVDQASLASVVLAWLFVVTRLAHALIHVTTNDLRRRFAWFSAGALILMVLWLVLAVQILLAS